MEVNNSPRNSNLLNTLKPLIILGFIFSLLSTHTVLAKSRRPVTVSFVRLLGSCFSSFSLDSTESCFNYSGCWNQAKEAGVLRRHREVSVYFKLFLGFFFFSHSSRIGCSCKMLWEQLWNVISPSLFFILSATALMGYDNALKCAVDCGVGNADLQLPKRKIVPCDVFLLLVMI